MPVGTPTFLRQAKHSIIALAICLLLAGCREAADIPRASIQPPTATAAASKTSAATNRAQRGTAIKSLTHTPVPSRTAIVLPSPTRSATDTSTVLPSPTRSATETSDPTLTTEPTTETRIAASVPTPSGISCGDYPCDDDIGGWLNRIQLPAGFMALYVASMPAGEQPTSISVGPGGRLFAAAMGGAIYVFAHDGTPSVYAEGLHLPTGIAFRPGTDEMFVASRVFPPNVSPNAGKVTVIQPDGSWQDIVTGLPCCYTPIMHQPNSVAFGPDGKVYLSIGALADHGEIPGQIGVQATRHPFEAGILRFNPDGSGLERYAAGLRNPYDLAFDMSGRLFATDNGPDVGGPEWLYEIEEGGHYSYPYYDFCEICPDPPPEATILPPIATFIPHGAISGITAYTAKSFPGDYINNLFVALWSAFPGAQKVVRIETDSPVRTSDFVLGLAAPVDLTQSPDGALLIADWATGHIFKTVYYP